MPDLVTLEPALLVAELDAALTFARAEKAESTRRAYRSDMAVFDAWAATRGLAALPAKPATVAAFLADQAKAGVAPSTLSRRLAALRYAHRLAGHDSPTEHEGVRATLRGIRRSLPRLPLRKKPATADCMRELVRNLPATPAGRRDRALLLLGFAGAFRRSELVALDVADCEEIADGLRIRIRRSKTDQEADGATIGVIRGGVPCPVQALKDWLTFAAIEQGPLFRPLTKSGRVLQSRLTDKSVAGIVKRHIARIGLQPADFAGHSLRAGFLTSAAARGASLFRMMDVSRHKSVETLRGYIREADLFKDHAGSGLL